MKLDRSKELIANSKVTLFGELGLKDSLGGLFGLRLGWEERQFFFFFLDEGGDKRRCLEAPFAVEISW